MSAYCPECDAEIDIDSADAEIGDELSCSECGSLLRVSNDSPVELEFADDDDDVDDDDDEEEKEEKEDDDFDDADDDDEDDKDDED
jgi:DNA-directed RNA polymerase subunit M/transcription elongation factor TFIIS